MRLQGNEVAQAIKKEIKQKIEIQKQQGKNPAVAVVRVGENSEDKAYENRVVKNCSEAGLEAKQITLPAETGETQLLEVIHQLNEDRDVQGVLVLRPLPKHISEQTVGCALNPEKDIDCMNPDNLKKLFLGEKPRIFPCTPEAVIAMLKHYNIALAGKHVVIVNRSLVLGKPLSLMLLEENATVTVCHSKTEELKSITQSADIVVTGVGKARFFDKSYFNKHTCVIDVGINFENGKMCGDVDYDTVHEHVDHLSPVPGGVGAVTSAVLLRHCVQ